MMSNVSSMTIMWLISLLVMSLLTLQEQKVLSYSQVRKGPNMSLWGGLAQPLSDATKLLTKKMILPKQVNKMPFYLSPLVMLSLSLMMWTLLPWTPSILIFKYSIMIFILISSLSVYSTLMASWTSNSKYSLMGSLRGVAQAISYEVSMAIMLFMILFYFQSLSFNKSSNYEKMELLVWSAPILFMWMICVLSELNRAPFDLMEGESELVSGFNTEYSSSGFTVLFMSEYINIFFMSILTTLLFSNFMSGGFVYSILALVLNSIIILIRSSYPRMRYDFVMYMSWFVILPYILSMFLFFNFSS